MRCVALLACLVFTLSLTVPATHAQECLGYSEETVLVESDRIWCGDIPQMNHDHSFENGYCWGHGANAPPYFGVFAEGFDLGAGMIDCGAYTLTQVGYYDGEPADCYVWEGGVSGPPGAVIGLVTGVVFDNIPFWPEVGRNKVEFLIEVDGEFATGCWGDWHEPCQWYYAVDENGPGGHPWTIITPGLGYPSGWHHPDMAFADCKSMGISVYFTRESSGVDELPEDAPPVESPTWGQIKAVFRD